MNDYVLVSLPSKEIRALARDALRGKWAAAAVATLIYLLAISVPTIILSALFPQALGTVESLYSLIVTGAFTYGYSLFMMSVFRRREHDNSQIFAGFEFFFKTLALYFLMTLFIILWMLLLIVPGIIAAFRYSQAFFIMVDHPEYSAFDCLNESKRITNGNKAKIFCLTFSFIGWIILASIPMAIFTNSVITPHLTSQMMMVGTGYTVPAAPVWMEAVSTGLMILGYMWLTPYVFAANVALYDMIVGNLRLEGGAGYVGMSAGSAFRRNDFTNATPYQDSNPFGDNGDSTFSQPQNESNPFAQQSENSGSGNDFYNQGTTGTNDSNGINGENGDVSHDGTGNGDDGSNFN